jgi:hypothetical protein
MNVEPSSETLQEPPSNSPPPTTAPTAAADLTKYDNEPVTRDAEESFNAKLHTAKAAAPKDAILEDSQKLPASKSTKKRTWKKPAVSMVHMCLSKLL